MAHLSFDDVSIVVPVLDDAEALAPLLPQIHRATGAEVAVVDGGSKDGSDALVSAPARLVRSQRGRARQMNAGVRATSRPWLWFVHADTQLDDACLLALRAALDDGCRWGRFDVRLSADAPALRMVAAMMNLRSAISSICTGDQGIFVSRALLEIVGGVPDQPLMEDIELSKRLRRFAPATRIRTPLVTSSRRWERDGIGRTVVLMWELRLRYFLGASPDVLMRRYYPGSRQSGSADE